MLTKQKMANVCIFYGDRDRDFAGEAMFNNHGGVNKSSEDGSVGKQLDIDPTFGNFSEAHTLTMKWVR